MNFSVKNKAHTLVPVQVPILLLLSLLSYCTDYALHFPNKGTTDYAVFKDVPSLTEFTLCFWMNSADQYPGTPFSYCCPFGEIDNENEVLIYNYGSLGLWIHNDGRWGSIKYYIYRTKIDYRRCTKIYEQSRYNRNSIDVTTEVVIQNVFQCLNTSFSS